jgi:hypothetical protein
MCSMRMQKAHCGSRIDWLCQGKQPWKNILDEAHTWRYSIHPGSIKMYRDLRQQFWWTRMKRETAHYVSECDTYRKVKANYMKPGGLLQPLSIPDWKWDYISMDFNVGLPLTSHKFWFDLGDRGSTHQICSPQGKQGLEVCWDLHTSCAMLARNSEDDHLRSMVKVCRSFLGATACAPRDSFDS